MTRRALGMFKTGPDVTSAAHSGQPQMNPPGQEGGESLGGGRGSNAIVVGSGGGGAQTGSSGPPPVRTVTPQETPSSSEAAANDPNASPDGNAQDAPKLATLVDQLPNHTDTAKKQKASPEESTSKKKKGFWKIIPF